MCPGRPDSRQEHRAAASLWAVQPSRESEHRGLRHGTRSQAPALRTPPPSRAAHAASGRCQKSPEPPRRSRADFAPRTQGLGFLCRPWRSSQGLPFPAAEPSGLGGTSREGRRLVATARPGSGAPRSRTGGRRSLPLCPGRAGVGTAAPAAASGTPPSSAQAARTSRALRAAPDAGGELAHQVGKAAGLLRLRLGRACCRKLI